MNPQRHPEPHRFNLDRYAGDSLSLVDSAANPKPIKPDQVTFGAGRRICPGMHVAERSLFLGIARMLWAFSFEPQFDTKGSPILPNPDRVTQGFVCQSEAFLVRIVPRSMERAKMVAQEWEDAKRDCLDPTTKQWQKLPADVKRKVSFRDISG